MDTAPVAYVVQLHMLNDRCGMSLRSFFLAFFPWYCLLRGSLQLLMFATSLSCSSVQSWSVLLIETFFFVSFTLQAIVTNHLVLRGTYRSLTLVIYGNTAEDLGQFNIELGLDHSLANVVSSPSEGKFEDLPPALRSSKFKFEESLSSIKPLSFQSTDLELSLEVKKILYLALKMHQIPNVENLIPDLGSAVISAVSKYVTSSNCMPHSWNQDLADGFSKSNLDPQESNNVHTEASNELFEIWKNVHSVAATRFSDNGFAVGLEELPTTKTIFELFNNSFPYYRNCSLLDLQCPSQVII